MVFQEKSQTGFLRKRLFTFLDLGENQLEGIFSQWLAEMKVTTTILSGNNLTGFLPSLLFNSPSLSTLLLYQNNFYGELPDNIGNASQLGFPMLGRNDFSVKVPESISNNSNLMLLDLSNNKLSWPNIARF